MSKISIYKSGTIDRTFSAGYSAVRILEETCPEVALELCVLQAGQEQSYEKYSRQDKLQIFVFTKGNGVLKAGAHCYIIDEQAVFIPDFDKDDLALTAGDKDLEFIHIIGDMNDTDRRQMANCQYVLPRFVKFSQSILYTERFTQESGAKVDQHSIIAGRHLGRYTMGWVKGTGPDFVGQHTHPTLDQWYFMLDGADFTYNAGDTPTAVKEGDVTYTPHGMPHGSSCEADGTINYLWFEMNHAWDNIEE